MNRQKKTTLNNLPQSPIFILLFLIIHFPLLHAQYPNLDFSNGDFSNWKCYQANSCEKEANEYDFFLFISIPATFSERHTIITDIHAKDKNACSDLALVPNGYDRCARLDNDTWGGNATSIRYTFTVDSSCYCFLIHYAAVLEFAHHESYKESRFGIRFQDTSGSMLPVNCTEVCIADTFQMTRCGERVYWKDWDVLFANLFPWIGKTVELVIYSSDCGSGGHFGYGYALCEAIPAQLHQYYCSEEQIIRLTAPDGFAAYEWRDSSGNPLSSNQYVRQIAQDGARYTCLVKTGKENESYTIHVTTHRTTVNAGFTFTCDTLNMKLHLKDTSRADGTGIANLQWKIFDRDSIQLYTSSDTVVDYCLPDTGNYTITLTAYAPNGCTSTRSLQLHLPAVTAIGIDSVKVSLAQHTAGGTAIPSNDEISIRTEARLFNRGNTDVKQLTACMEVYGEDGTLLKQTSNPLSRLNKQTDTVSAITSTIHVPEYEKTFRVKVYISAPDLMDTDRSDDTLETMFTYRTGVTDASVDSIILPEQRPYTAGSLQQFKASIGNPGTQLLKNIILNADVLDSGFTELRLMQKKIDTLGAQSHREITFPGCTLPDQEGTYLLRVYVSHVYGDNNAANDTLWNVFEVQRPDAINNQEETLWQLGQNIPNPADRQTLIPITLPTAGTIRMRLYAANGQLLLRSEQELPSGQSLLPVKTEGFASGTYFYSVEYNGQRKIGKMNVR